ncbi:DUF6984 family protein [Acidovorax sp. LjRoot129]|uniref:DUF6984 family protein n=1 Tax=Acidovorax sp. LjRoot129 TaxID=3342260 RepID=UPI003F50C31A
MRKLYPYELPLISYLFAVPGIDDDLGELLVESTADGGMGSLAIDRVNTALRFGCCVAQCEFHDADGVNIQASLNCDTAGRPMEVDVWKVNFTPITQWPKRAEIRPLSSASLGSRARHS